MKMKSSSRLLAALLAATLSLPALALSLNEAMSALGNAKAAGQLGEQANGYLGVVNAGGNTQANEIARLINDARRSEYQRLARENGLQLGDVEAMAGQKALEKTPSGQYIQSGGKWQRK